MRGEVRAHQIAVPIPLVFGVGRGVDPHVAVAGGDVVLERVLLLGCQDIARGREEHDRVVLGEIRRRERGRILGGVDLEAVGRADLLNRRDAGRDRVVTERGRLGEHEHVLERCGGGDARAC